MKKIMYVHGFGSAASTNTVKVFQSLLPDVEVFAEDMPLDPNEAMALLRRLCEEQKPDLIIGTSMGGMYTEQLHGFDRILINPALEMGKTMASHGMIGKQVYQNPRKDGVQEFIVTKAMTKLYDEITTHNFENVTPEEQRRVWGLFGDKDPLVNTFDMFHEHYPQAVRFHGEHRLTESIIVHYVLPLIRQIDDRQQGRERPSLFITFDALRDAYDKPRSSMHKAYEDLLAHYNIYVVAPAPTNDHSFMPKVQEWVEEYLSAPAFDKVIFTNKPDMLIGDFLIDVCDHPDFMGTTIELGSDQFKTWEEVIVFYQRLRGE